MPHSIVPVIPQTSGCPLKFGGRPKRTRPAAGVASPCRSGRRLPRSRVLDRLGNNPHGPRLRLGGGARKSSPGPKPAAAGGDGHHGPLRADLPGRCLDRSRQEEAVADAIRGLAVLPTRSNRCPPSLVAKTAIGAASGCTPVWPSRTHSSGPRDPVCTARAVTILLEVRPMRAAGSPATACLKRT